jgi:CheY-like chemotaxis protein
MARILLIDDDDSFREMLRLTLTHFGHTVIEARDGKAGLKLLPQANADLVMTDIVMPEKDGIEVILELKNIRPNLKIIAMSGGARISAATHLLAARQLGAAKILSKPFTNEALIAAIGELLPDAPAAPPTGA